MKANKGAPRVDVMTIEAALPWLKEHQYELTERIRKGKYTLSPIRQVFSGRKGSENDRDSVRMIMGDYRIISYGKVWMIAYII